MLLIPGERSAHHRLCAPLKIARLSPYGRWIGQISNQGQSSVFINRKVKCIQKGHAMVSKLRFKKSTIVLSVLVLLALSSLSSALVQAAPPAAQATEASCPALDPNNSLITEYAIPTEKSGPT